MEKRKLFVGNLPPSITSESLKELFKSCGEIIDVTIIMDHYTGRSKGFGFVTFAYEAEAKRAITELSNKEIDGRRIIVIISKPD